ncbi:MAG: hypothetical protein U1G07_18935 [Verrucomicrobiota bacterium]
MGKSERVYFASGISEAAGAAGDSASASERRERWILRIGRPCAFKADLQLAAVDEGQDPCAEGYGRWSGPKIGDLFDINRTETQLSKMTNAGNRILKHTVSGRRHEGKRGPKRAVKRDLAVIKATV